MKTPSLSFVYGRCLTNQDAERQVLALDMRRSFMCTLGSIFISIGAKSMRRYSLHEDAQICLYDRFEFEFVLLSGRFLSNKCHRLIPLTNIKKPILSYLYYTT